MPCCVRHDAIRHNAISQQGIPRRLYMAVPLGGQTQHRCNSEYDEQDFAQWKYLKNAIFYGLNEIFVYAAAKEECRFGLDRIICLYMI